MTEERLIQLFHFCLSQLRVGDDGLEAGHSLGQLEAIAHLAHTVKAITSVPDNPHDVCLFELADASEALICSAVLDADAGVVERWTRARVEVLNCQLGALG